MPLQGGLSIERMCELARVSRASFYRSLKEQRPAEEETEVRSAIQQIALEHRRRYGYRRICAELRRRGMPLNHTAKQSALRPEQRARTTSPSGPAMPLCCLRALNSSNLPQLKFSTLSARMIHPRRPPDGGVVGSHRGKSCGQRPSCLSVSAKNKLR
jgi:HTH-like domain